MFSVSILAFPYAGQSSEPLQELKPIAINTIARIISIVFHNELILFHKVIKCFVIIKISYNVLLTNFSL